MPVFRWGLNALISGSADCSRLHSSLPWAAPSAASCVTPFAGAGKTAIAEAAAAATLARGQRVIYTTPLKALSNQKLAEKSARFGSNRCGLQTGDTSLNTEADIVVMTTEILRNIMYRCDTARQVHSSRPCPCSRHAYACAPAKHACRGMLLQST